MSKYHSESPKLELDPDFKSFFQDFYATSDTPGADAAWVQYFTPDATVIMASKKAVGAEEILALRQSMWTAVSSRSHNPIKIFPFGSYSDELMLYGTVAYEFKAGGGKEVDWAARVNLMKEEDGGKVRMRFYQVYLDTAAPGK